MTSRSSATSNNDINKNTRFQQLDLAYKKTIDMSVNTIGDEELKECFGDIKTQVGNSLQRLFINHMVNKTQNNLKVHLNLFQSFVIMIFIFILDFFRRYLFKT